LSTPAFSERRITKNARWPSADLLPGRSFFA